MIDKFPQHEQPNNQSTETVPDLDQENDPTGLADRVTQILHSDAPGEGPDESITAVQLFGDFDKDPDQRYLGLRDCITKQLPHALDWRSSDEVRSQTIDRSFASGIQVFAPHGAVKERLRLDRNGEPIDSPYPHTAKEMYVSSVVAFDTVVKRDITLLEEQYGRDMYAGTETDERPATVVLFTERPATDDEWSTGEVDPAAGHDSLKYHVRFGKEIKTGAFIHDDGTVIPFHTPFTAGEYATTTEPLNAQDPEYKQVIDELNEFVDSRLNPDKLEENTDNESQPTKEPDYSQPDSGLKF